jgi:hypothetical protein
MTSSDYLKKKERPEGRSLSRFRASLLRREYRRVGDRNLQAAGGEE